MKWNCLESLAGTKFLWQILLMIISSPKNAVVHDLHTSTVWFDEDGILWSVSKKVPQPSIEENKEILKMFEKITGGKKVCMLADVTNTTESTREMREWAAEELPKLVKAVAMVSDSALGKMLANMFFRLKTQPYPVKMFNDVDSALKWLKQYL